jgi:aromatic ring hydroxylase
MTTVPVKQKKEAQDDRLKELAERIYRQALPYNRDDRYRVLGLLWEMAREEITNGTRS